MKRPYKAPEVVSLDLRRLRETNAELLAFTQRVAEYFHYREDDGRPLAQILADVEADARRVLAKAEAK